MKSIFVLGYIIYLVYLLSGLSKGIVYERIVTFEFFFNSI